MKALLIKDLYILRRRMGMVLLLVLIFGVVPSEFQNVFAVTYSAMIPYSVLSVDESSKWDRLAAMLPYSVREIVLSKYLLGGGCILLSALAVWLLQTVVEMVSGAGAFRGTPVFCAGCVAMLTIDLVLPLAFRFGIDRARMISLLALGGVCGGAGALSSMGGSVSMIPVGVLPVLAAVTALLTALSACTAVRLYPRRERS